MFTPSVQEAKPFSADNDAKMFSVTSLESDVFSNSMADVLSSQSTLHDSGRFAQSSAAAPGSAPGSNMPTRSVIGQEQRNLDAMSREQRGQDGLSASNMPPKPIGQNSMGHMGQRLEPVASYSTVIYAPSTL